ncbi:hypothetical protein A9G34_07600 [Gilliamella sp. Choc4-2]|jgi:hypothetical protein|uniref:hypothetical protein n=1 Tax=unclassified Gilliamella TaxID=2685620 RepID=UPI0004DCB14D|nr:hypothetical protein [Gilliamella apicola]KFA58855.1 hypothetical protein GAPWKB11_0744 [Gilliamella apicola]OCG31834.1 hypothetical protein A9G33_04680 [Gilliamella apicola]OCG43847.1 hypothetical protein A9G34_07600 [Gilliamella apicola]OCG54923.1 hypothetical protein A9G36_06980 [Gilliamella apicola]OCG64930.1 hypothetical protein A9G48_01505 [Gilliamella apicola]
MKVKIIPLSCVVLSMALIGCGGNSKGKESHWSKPHGVLEDCSGVMSNSQQCQKNSSNQQFMIQIDRN